MSQVYKSAASGPVPPTVPTSFVTDVRDNSTTGPGTAIPAANVLDVFGGQTTQNNSNGIRTDANPNNGNVLYVELTNRVQGTATTVGAVTADVITFALGGTAGSYKFFFNLIAFNSATPAAGGYAIDATARTTGAAGTIVSVPDGDEDEDAALVTADWDVVASANNAILRVTGVAGLTINWSAVGYYVFVS